MFPKWHILNLYAIEKTEVAIKNEHSKGTGHIGNKTQAKQKTKHRKLQR
jgi:hypothetical protein